MGLLDRSKKKTTAASGMSEFDLDIKELLARDDVQCREDICKAELKKALSLLEEEPTKENLLRAVDIIRWLGGMLEYAPAMLVMGHFLENALKQPEKAAVWFRNAADNGDGAGARCYADMLMAGNGVAQDIGKAMHYYSLAAERGVPEAAFVLGEFYRNAGDNDQAVKMYKKAFEGGYAPAQIRLQQMGKL